MSAWRDVSDDEVVNVYHQGGVSGDITVRWRTAGTFKGLTGSINKC